MAKATLLLGDASYAVAGLPLFTNCTLFRNNLALAASPYRVNSLVALEVFRLFLEAVEGKEIQITKQNVAKLSQLCTEFGFENLSRKISVFLDSPDCASADPEARARILDLEERYLQQDRRIASVEAIVSQMQTDFAHQIAEVQTTLAQQRDASAASGPPGQLAAPMEQLKACSDELKTEQTEQTEQEQQLAALKAWWTSPLDSRIVASFPPLFDEFRGKRSALLWRGSRDGFRARDFHGRCDRRANTLTLILDTRGNVFGGFTPLEWESEWKLKCDDSLKSFLFTLKNPHNIPARKFALMAEKKHLTICCESSLGPQFGGMWVSDNCNTNTDSCTCLGNAYTNDTGLDRKTVFTGSFNFQVREIEVFEIAD
jgi:hypothetical protein